MDTTRTEYVIDVLTSDFLEKAKAHLQTEGFVVLRNAFSVDLLENVKQSVSKVLSQPALGGSIGYYMKDPHKKMYDALLVGRSAVRMIANEKIIETIQAYLGGEVLLTEAFLKNDLGTNEVYFPYHSHTGADLNLNDNKLPFGCGTMIYLHDTNEGAFCYSPGTHSLRSPHGSNPYEYPDAMKNQILSNMKRVSGKAGDIVIFDESGFHGPEQPVQQPRTAFLFGYQLKSLSENRVRNPAPVVLTDLQGLTSTQLDALGMNSGSRNQYFDYHIRSFDKSNTYTKLSGKFKSSFAYKLRKAKMKTFVKALVKGTQ